MAYNGIDQSAPTYLSDPTSPIITMRASTHTYRSPVKPTLLICQI